MCTVVSYIPHATYLKEKAGNIITFIQFEQGGLLSENHYDAERGDESNDDSIIAPIIIKEEMDAVNSRDEFEGESMYAEMLEDISDGSKSHLSVNSRDAHYKIRDTIKKQCKQNRKDGYYLCKAWLQVYTK